jgi:hypothetical protein
MSGEIIYWDGEGYYAARQQPDGIITVKVDEDQPDAHARRLGLGTAIWISEEELIQKEEDGIVVDRDDISGGYRWL